MNIPIDMKGLQALLLNMHINPTADAVKGYRDAASLNNKALQRFHAGDFVGAEELHLKALRIKEKAFDGDSIEVALTRNALGEAQLRQGKLDEAQRNLEIAVRIRNSASSKNRDHVPDAAVSRENLAQVFEAKGNLAEAKRIRLKGAPDKMVCSNYDCPKAVLTRKQLRTCSGCESVFYCSPECQKRDWRSRHKSSCPGRATMHK